MSGVSQCVGPATPYAVMAASFAVAAAIGWFGWGMIYTSYRRDSESGSVDE